MWHLWCRHDDRVGFVKSRSKVSHARSTTPKYLDATTHAMKQSECFVINMLTIPSAQCFLKNFACRNSRVFAKPIWSTKRRSENCVKGFKSWHETRTIGLNNDITGEAFTLTALRRISADRKFGNNRKEIFSSIVDLRGDQKERGNSTTGIMCCTHGEPIDINQSS